MRRKEREIAETSEVLTILHREQVARVALCDDGQPYIVPLSFAVHEGDEGVVLYFHCALEGRKMALLKIDGRVAFEVDGACRILPGEEACDWSLAFESVVGEGLLSVVQDPAERVLGMDLIMAKYGFEGKPVYDPAVFQRTAILALSVTRMTGKRLALA